MAEIPDSFPTWDREELIRLIQRTDGCTRGEAEQQIEAFERRVRARGVATTPIGAERKDKQ